MKTLYKVIQYQTYDVEVKRGFKKEIQQGWCIRNPHFIYANSEQEAIKKYEERYGLNTSNNIFYGWEDIISKSDNSGDVFNKRKISNVYCFIDTIEFHGRETTKQLIADMNAFEFREWWFDKNEE